MNNKDFIYISIIILILILIIYCFINLNKYTNYVDITVDKNNNFKYNDFKYDDIKKIDNNFLYDMPPANNDIDNNIDNGFVNELMKNNINKEGSYFNVYDNKIDIVNDNDIGFCTKTKEQKKELPFANININYLQQ